MTKRELQFIGDLLYKIKDPDEQVAKAISYVNKDLAQYEARKGQLKDQYEYDSIHP